MTYVKTYTKDDGTTTRFVEQSDIMIDIAMAASMKEVKTIVKQWKADLNEVDTYRRENSDSGRTEA